MSATTLRQWLQEEPYTLALSSGFFGFFAHCGVLAALVEQGLLPTAVAGSSAGAIVGGCWAAGLSTQAMRQQLLALRREDFWDPGVGLGLLRGGLFRQKLKNLLPVNEFSDCHIPVSISVYDVLSFKTKAVKEGDLAAAIQASCAVPFMFRPVWINRRPYVDGGVADHGGLHGVKRGGRVFYHHLLSHKNDYWRILPRRPLRQNMVTLAIYDLPDVGPFKLHNSADAYQQGYETMNRILDKSISDSIFVERATK